jgi:hypothetical protein
MAKLKKGKVRPYVMLRMDLLNHRAYKELPSSASRMLPYFVAKVKTPFWEKEYYLTEFTFPYAEAVNCGCPRRTFATVIRALMRHGFIDPVKKGGRRCFAGLGPSVFKLSKRWELYGNVAFEAMEWECFGEDQIRRQGQKVHTIGAKSEPKFG